MQILKIELRREVDTDPDTSWIGEYRSTPGADDLTIDREARGDMERNEYRYFIAAMSGNDTGNPESVQQDYERMESLNRGDWGYLGISSVAKIQLGQSSPIQKILSGGLWGIESDSGADELESVENEQLAELRGELLAIGFDAEKIDAAMVNVDRKE